MRHYRIVREATRFDGYSVEATSSTGSWHVQAVTMTYWGARLSVWSRKRGDRRSQKAREKVVWEDK